MISNSLYSQNGYPKQIVINKDTIEAISMQQVKALNLLQLDYVECSDTRNAFIVKIKEDSILISKQREYESLLNNRLNAQKDIIINDNVIYQNLKNDLEKSNKLYKREKIKVGIFGGFSAILVGIITTLLIVK
jgi:hypothetical protein